QCGSRLLAFLIRADSADHGTGRFQREERGLPSLDTSSAKRASYFCVASSQPNVLVARSCALPPNSSQRFASPTNREIPAARSALSARKGIPTSAAVSR